MDTILFVRENGYYEPYFTDQIQNVNSLLVTVRESEGKETKQLSPVYERKKRMNWHKSGNKGQEVLYSTL